MSPFVHDVMHRGVTICNMDTRLEEVAKRMCDAHASAIVVVDSLGEVAGIISSTDLAQAYVSDKLDSQAEDIMTTSVATIVANIPVEAAIQIMLDRRIHQLVIMHARPAPGRPVGMLSMNDIMRLIADNC